MNTIQELYEYFCLEYSNLINRVVKSVNFYQTNEDYTYELNKTVIEKSFLDIFLLWENFLEESFLIYLLGNTDLCGNQYISYVNPIDKEHAYKIVKGTQRYPDWTNIEHVIQLVCIYFEENGPYGALCNIPVELIEIKKIRNKLSHISVNADTIFRNMLRSKNINSTLNIAQFLMEYKGNRITYFTYYTNYIKTLVNMICNADT